MLETISIINRKPIIICTWISKSTDNRSMLRSPNIQSTIESNTLSKVQERQPITEIKYETVMKIINPIRLKYKIQISNNE